MKTRLLVALCIVLTGQPALAEMTDDEIRKKPTAEVEAKLPAEHPAAYYLYALRLFGEDRKNDAVFWFYAGQLRYRFHLNANPSIPLDRDPAVMASLNSTVGQVVNEYAGGDPKMWVTQIDRVLKWDAETQNGFTSKEKYKTQWQEIRSGLSSLRAMIERDADKMKQQRENAGLPNR